MEKEQEKEDFLQEYNALYKAFFSSRYYAESEFQGLLLQQRQISSAADNKEFIFLPVIDLLWLRLFSGSFVSSKYLQSITPVFQQPLLFLQTSN